MSNNPAMIITTIVTGPLESSTVSYSNNGIKHVLDEVNQTEFIPGSYVEMVRIETDLTMYFYKSNI